MKVLVILVIAVIGVALAKPSNRQVQIKKLIQALKEKKVVKDEDKSYSGYGGYSGYSSGYGGSGYYGFFDWEQHIQDTCNINLEDLYAGFDQPVDATEFASALNIAQEMTARLNDVSANTQANLATLEANLADPTVDLAGFITQHGGLAHNFGQAFEQMYNLGFCSVVQIGPLRERMEVNGMTGFATSHKCNRLGVFINALYMSNMWDDAAVSAAVVADIAKVGNMLRGDVSCMLRDIRDFRDFASTIQVDTSMSARQAMLTVDALQGYLYDLGEDAMNLLHATDIVGYMIDYDTYGSGYDKKKEVTKVENKNQQLVDKLNKLLKTMRQLR